MDCPECGEPDMLFYRGDDYEENGSVYTEPDTFECTECGHAEVM